MGFPRWMPAFNRRVTNRVTGRFATWAPGFGVVVHRGRRSGRTYRTPVNVFTTPDGYMVALTYGTESDWVRNVMAEGGCELETRGRVLHLGSPRIVHDDSLRMAPPAIRPILRMLDVADLLMLSPRAG
jgi:deazaflavin-dependent oxidoreductase (nitroreductase family)